MDGDSGGATWRAVGARVTAPPSQAMSSSFGSLRRVHPEGAGQRRDSGGCAQSPPSRSLAASPALAGE